MSILEQRRVVIVGGGLMGCSIATGLARRGADVHVIEASPGPGMGSTAASSAVIRFHYSTEAGTALAYEGLHYWRNWAEHIGVEPEGGLVELVTTGMVGLADGTGHLDRCRPILERLGVPHEWWDTEELARRMPYLDTGAFFPPTRPDDDRFFADPASVITGALYEPDAGYVTDPQLAAANLHDAAVAAGARFAFNTRVTEIDVAEGRVIGVRLDDGAPVEADIVINAAGPYSASINAMAGLEGSMTIGTRPMRQEVHHVPGPATPATDEPIPALGDGDSGFYYRPDAHGNLLVGSLEPECDPLEWLDDADEADEGLSEQWEVQTLRVARRIPELGVPHDRRGVVGVYDASDDWIPIYDRTDLDGFYVAIGTSGNQFKNAGPVGTLMTDLIEAVEGGHDHDAEPVVYTGTYTGLPIDLGTFARNRTVNTGSSMSVRG
ncbi:MAG: FAD-dependent oxidoreductase [Actinomycetota bacterium]